MPPTTTPPLLVTEVAVHPERIAALASTLLRQAQERQGGRNVRDGDRQARAERALAFTTLSRCLSSGLSTESAAVAIHAADLGALDIRGLSLRSLLRLRVGVRAMEIATADLRVNDLMKIPGSSPHFIRQRIDREFARRRPECEVIARKISAYRPGELSLYSEDVAFTVGLRLSGLAVGVLADGTVQDAGRPEWREQALRETEACLRDPDRSRAWRKAPLSVDESTQQLRTRLFENQNPQSPQDPQTPTAMR